MYRIPTFCIFCTAKHHQKLENPSSKLETEFAPQSMTCPSGRVIGDSLQERFSKLLQFIPEKPPTCTLKDEQDEIIRAKFLQRELIKVI